MIWRMIVYPNKTVTYRLGEQRARVGHHFFEAVVGYVVLRWRLDP